VADFDFPSDLLELQRAFFAAEAAWEQAGASGDAEVIAAAYQRTQDVVMALHRHPWMNATENRYEARMALRRAVQSESST
jgi:hypothetical protein